MSGKNKKTVRKNKKEDSKKTQTDHIKTRGFEGVKEVNPSDYEFLKKVMTDHGRIMPSRFSGLNAKQQRKVKKAIKRARIIGVLP